MPETRPVGQLYRNTYAAPAQAQSESPRFRSRLYAIFGALNVSDRVKADMVSALRASTGAVIRRHVTGDSAFEQFFTEGSITDVLSFITIIYRHLTQPGRARDTWQASIAQLFEEENILYVVDERCGVHPKIDTEFQRGVQSAMVRLADPKFAAARVAFQAGYDALAATPPDYVSADQNLFVAMETVFRLVCDNKQMTAANIKTAFFPVVQRRYTSADPATVQTYTNFVNSFSDWVAAANPYRHGHGSAMPIAPPDELALAQFSTGAGFLRWLTTFQ